MIRAALAILLAAAVAAAQADRAVARTDSNSLRAHRQLLEKRRQGTIGVYFEGDSIVRRWGALDQVDLLANWQENFFGWNAADFGWGSDTTQNILWRLENGELDGVNPKAIVLLAGTTNIARHDPPADIAKGIEAIVRVMQEKAPGAVVIVTAIFPRSDNKALLPAIRDVNARLAQFADGKKVRYLDINDRLRPGMMETDGVHPTVEGYQVWADALKPLLTEILGPPAKEDHAPPPSSDH